ncbi:nuclear transport factor 2 family protein [Euryhalocaulis caribicus]|uniref:nuclear transport factor 2 family protein n=1 Tax=Euryhalocaulis caribicus TaxID=1161401 RepID=UPI0003A7B071|nr:nuclear transport factor 2 family protein [Euryhalocaulis caribicus]
MARMTISLGGVTAAMALAVAPGALGQDRDGEPETGNAELLALNTALFESMIVERDAALFNETAAEDFRVLAPGGMVEGKAQAAAGVAAWDASGITVSGEEVVRQGDLAIVTGRLDIDGVMKPVGRWGPLKHMSVYQQTDGEWRLVSRSLTPCAEMLIKLDRC